MRSSRIFINLPNLFYSSILTKKDFLFTLRTQVVKKVKSKGFGGLKSQRPYIIPGMPPIPGGIPPGGPAGDGPCLEAMTSSILRIMAATSVADSMI